MLISIYLGNCINFLFKFQPMRTVLFIIPIICLCFHTSNAQMSKTHNGRQSASTLHFISTYNKSVDHLQKSSYIYSSIGGENYVSGFLKVNNQLTDNDLSNLGIIIGTKAGDIWTAKIPVENVEKLVSLTEGIEYIQLDRPIHSNLEKALQKTKVDSVHNGIFLPQAYTGQDVIVGIMDVGFDYTHPVFYDVNGEHYRVQRVWEQKSMGTPPNGYTYGHEMIDSLEIISGETDNSNESHGSHVAGIAAGSGFGGDGSKYRGVAFNSELVFVGITPEQGQWKNTGMTDIIDGLNYIFNYAESVGKPAVANLSWGCSIGPHDGSSLFGQAVDNLTGEGKIFTISAGNNGTSKIHLQRTFNSNDTLIQSFIDFSPNFPEKKSWLDIWGDAGEEFCIQLKLHEGTTEKSASEYFCLDNSTIDTFLIGSDNDTMFFKISTFEADLNGKSHAFIDLDSKTSNNLSIGVKGYSGVVNLWLGYVYDTRGYYGEFSTKGQSWATLGNNSMTIGEMACTKSAITVAAYASKTNFTNLDGDSFSYNNYVQVNKLCPFSSRGPAAGSFQKPDITAPGMTLASAVNSFDISYASGGDNSNGSVHKYIDPNTSKAYYFAESSGTSMSSPMAAGIVALVLEEDPTASPEDIKLLMANTAIKDNFTTDTPNPNNWGAGKIMHMIC